MVYPSIFRGTTNILILDIVLHLKNKQTTAYVMREIVPPFLIEDIVYLDVPDPTMILHKLHQLSHGGMTITNTCTNMDMCILQGTKCSHGDS